MAHAITLCIRLKITYTLCLLCEMEGRKKERKKVRKKGIVFTVLVIEKFTVKLYANSLTNLCLC